MPTRRNPALICAFHALHRWGIDRHGQHPILALLGAALVTGTALATWKLRRHLRER